MNTTTCLLLACLLGLVSAKSIETRIVGGTNTTDGQYPFAVSIRIAVNNHFCGGAILSPTAILTASSCIEWIPIERIEAVVRANLLNEGGVRYRAKGLRVHPYYNPETLEYDIGLYYPVRDIEFTPRIQPVALGQDFVQGNNVARLLGWGRTSMTINLHNNLLYLDLNTMDNPSCTAAYENTTSIADYHLCAFSRLGQGGCTRDYGGPLIINNTVVAVYSFSRINNEVQCAVGYPDVFTRVATFYNWINDNLICTLC